MLNFKFNCCILIVFIITFLGCSNINEKGSPEYIDSIMQWHKRRIENLKKENGWLNLAGLYWLNEGNNAFGSDPSNNIVFPKDKAPKFIGTFILKNRKVFVKINDGIKITTEGKPVTEMNLVSDSAGDTTVLAFGSLRWFYIIRQNKFGIRLRDLDAPLIKEFKGIETYPVNQDWRLEAKFVPYNPPKIISVPSIIGTVDRDTVLGALAFQINGDQYKIDPVDEGNDFFIIFADETNGTETYGAGRFIYTSKPDSTGKVILDFNKAYNPPCAFTKFATCPLPPEQNYMHIKVTAGEKTYRGGHH